MVVKDNTKTKHSTEGHILYNYICMKYTQQTNQIHGNKSILVVE